MFTASTYINRRNKLKQLLGTGMIIIPGNNELPVNYAGNPYYFRQDSTVLYLTGIQKPNMVLVIDIDNNKEILFGDDIDIEDIIWTGPQSSVKQYAEKCGISSSKPWRDLNGFFNNTKATVHYTPAYRPEHFDVLNSILNWPKEKIKSNYSLPLIKALVAIRSYKESCELKQIEEAAYSGYNMHMTAMKLCAEGRYEYELCGQMEGMAKASGGNISFPVILSQKGEILHNHAHDLQLKNGNLLLIDAGTETIMGYASDFTRTLPVGGAFTTKQKEIYDIVLRANNEAFKLIKPGVTYLSVHLECAKIITEGLKHLGLMQGNTEEIVEEGAHALFFPHGLGHMIGLDVHDMENYGEDFVGYDNQTKRSDLFGTAYLRLGRKLEEDFVITIEPGIYFVPELINKWKDERLHHAFINWDKVDNYLDFGGIRIEDDVIVTENGCRYTGKRLPVTPDELYNTLTDDTIIK